MLELDVIITCSNILSFSFSTMFQSDQFLFSWGRFLYGAESLCKREAVMLLTEVVSCIFSLNSTDCQSEVSLMRCCTKTVWNSRLKGCGIINQEFRSFSGFLKVPVNIVTDKRTGFTSDRDSLSWNNRLSWRLSQDDLSWWTWKTWKKGEGLLRQIQFGERWSTSKQKRIISLTWRTDGRRSMLLVSVFLHHSRTSLWWTWSHPEAKFSPESLTLNKEPQGGQQENQWHHHCAAGVSVSLKGLDSHWSTLVS